MTTISLFLITFGLLLVSTIYADLDDYKLFMDVFQEQSRNESSFNIAVSPILLNRIFDVVRNPLNRTCDGTEMGKIWFNFVIMLYDSNHFNFKICAEEEQNLLFLNVNDNQVEDLMQKNNLENLTLAAIGLITFEDVWSEHFKMYKYGKVFWSEKYRDYTFPQAIAAEGIYPYFEDANIRCVKMPIQNDLLIEVIAPKQPIVNITKNLEIVIDNYEYIISNLRPTNIILRIPRFRFTNIIDLNKVNKENDLDGIVQILNFEAKMPYKYIYNDSEDVSEEWTPIFINNTFILTIYSTKLNRTLLVTAINEADYGW